MKIIGLTGGIGMGKSTAAAAFRRAHLPVFDADAAVHRLQAPGGRALPAIARAFPGTVQGGVLDRAKLRQFVLEDRARLRELEAILHPLVRSEQRRFLARARIRRRGTMDEAQAARVIALQLPDRERVRQADLVVRTGLSRFHALRAIRRWLHARFPSRR